MEWVQITIDVGVVLVAIIGGWMWLRSKTTKDLQSELEQLVDLRGKMIQDLEAKIDRLSGRVDALEAEMSAVYKIKAEEIATLVVEKMNGG